MCQPHLEGPHPPGEAVFLEGPTRGRALGLRGTGQKATYRGAELRCPAARPQRAPQRGLTRRLGPLGPTSARELGESLWLLGLPCAACVHRFLSGAGATAVSGLWFPPRHSPFGSPLPPGSGRPSRASGLWVGGSPQLPGLPHPWHSRGTQPCAQGSRESGPGPCGRGESGTGGGGRWGVGDGREGSHSPK